MSDIQVGFSSSSFSALEGEVPPHAPSSVSVCVTISGTLSGQLDISVNTVDIGSATGKCCVLWDHSLYEVMRVVNVIVSKAGDGHYHLDVRL